MAVLISASAGSVRMLRQTSGGGAKNSLHLTGQAMDVRFPDLPTRHIRDTAIALTADQL